MSAVISKCGKYRYHLTRDLGNLGAIGPPLTFMMLNPSTADAEIDDQTIRKCIGFANEIGRFWSITVVNLFAYRATKPTDLLFVDDPVGPENEACLRAAINSSGPIIVAWGSHQKIRKLIHPQVTRVLKLLEQSNRTTFECLGQNLNGSPRHPLMLPYTTKVRDWVPNL